MIVSGPISHGGGIRLLNAVLRLKLMGLLLTMSYGSSAAAPAQEPLFQAIRTGNLVEIKRALAGGISARAIDANGTPALMAATLFCDVTAMKFLLDRGADPNATNAAGATALMWAIPELAKVKLLVARAANVNARSANLGRTPFLVAAGYPRAAEVLQVLVREGADIRVKDKNGMHALGRAVLLADIQTVRFLVENGADIGDRDGFGEYGLGLTFARQDVEIAEYLLSHGVKLRREALSIASNARSVTLLDRVLAAGADVNAPIVFLKSTPLIMATAAEQTRSDSLKWLLEKGADPNAEGINGDRALDWAFYRADQSRIDLLKRYGAKPGAAARAGAYARPEGIADPRVAVERSASLLLATGPVVFKTRVCITCHNQTLAMQVAIAAREKGISIDERLLEINLKQTLAFYRPFAEEAMQGEQPADNTLQLGYALTALAAQSYPFDQTTASLTHLITSLQRVNGSWLGEGVSRPPIEDSNVSTTVMAVRALTLYAQPGQENLLRQTLRKARGWLVSVPASSAEERNMRLMGLVWTKAPRHDVQLAIEEVLRRQKPDGGWSQLDPLAADAYATGMSLYALHEAGMTVTNDVYRNGVGYLLRNQYADGSWLVKSRAYPTQPYFESGFPFRQHQFISAAGSSWASLAIAHTLQTANTKGRP